MNQTIDQVLQQAIAHHQAGQWQEAEGLYRGILGTQRHHPDANHNLGVLRVQMNQAAAALPHFKAALEANPEVEQYWLSYVDGLLQAGSPDVARQVIDAGRLRGFNGDALDALAARLDSGAPSAQAIATLVSLFAAGRYGEVEALAHTMTEQFPAHVAGWKVLGLVRMEMGQVAQALLPMQRNTTLSPSDAEAHSNLGYALSTSGQLGQLEAAEISCRRALQLKPDYAQAHNNLGFTLYQLGRFEEAIGCYRAAIALDPALLAAHGGLASALARLVPLWHVPMMNDTLRNAAYYEALRAAVTPDSNVFEIGTGSGLLSMMAARLGAKSVTTCEAEPLVAATAKEVIAANGLDQRIRLIGKKSTAIELGEDLPQRADILVSEILSSELLAEHVLSSIEDAKRRLIKPGCRIIPAAGSIMIALFGGEGLGSNLAVEEACGFNLRPFNKIVPRRQTIARSDLAIDLLSADTAAFRFDFEHALGAAPQTKTLRIAVTTAGRCLGIIQWIRLEMFADKVFENHPSVKAAASGWTRCAYVFASPVELKVGQVAIVSAAHNRVMPWFDLLRIESCPEPAV